MSVKDYLLSQHQVGATAFSINEKLSHSHVAQTCLAYLLQFNNLNMLNQNTIGNFPLARYAARYWILHLRSVGDEWDDVQQKLVMTLFQPQHNTRFISWLRLWNIELPWMLPQWDLIKVKPSAIYYAAFAGLLPVVWALIENGEDVNAQGGEFGNALQAASLEGHEAIVSMLLEKGADMSAQGGKYGNALQAASTGGHEQIVRLLLEKGVDVNAQGGFYGNALQAASSKGHTVIVDLLLEQGADQSIL